MCVCGGGSYPRSWTYFRCGKPSHETVFRTVNINTIVKRCEKNMGFVYSLSSYMVCRKILPFSSMILPAINPHLVWGHCWAARQWATKSVSVPVNPHEPENYESGPGKLKITFCSIPGLQKRGEECKWFCIETWIQQDFPMIVPCFSHWNLQVFPQIHRCATGIDQAWAIWEVFGNLEIRLREDAGAGHGNLSATAATVVKSVCFTNGPKHLHQIIENSDGYTL